MRVNFTYISTIALSMVFLTSCSDNEILTTYEEVKEQADPVPLIFKPYISASIESEATTRANLNYLAGVLRSGKNSEMENFRSFPWFDETAALNQPWNITGLGSETGARNTGPKPAYRLGKYTNNSYIVGIYGYYGLNNDVPMTWDEMTNDTYLSSLTSSFMTNQPLLHTAGKPNTKEDVPYTDVWEYSPLRYWPNSTNNDNVKVTFVSYYPFQDFEERGIGIDDNGKITGNGYYRDGRDLDGDEIADLADLRCITPPAKDAKGKDAYLFTFKQNENISEHIDFLLGLDKDETKQGVGNGIDLTLKHTLCAVMFDLRTNGVGTGVTYEINSVSLEGLYGKGKVYPTTSGIVWESQYLDEITNYTLDFAEHADTSTGHDLFNGHFVKPVFSGNNKIRYSRHLIYQNDKQKVEGIITVNGVEKNINGADINYVNNSRGMECLMLVIPQEVEVDKDGNLKDAYLVVNYDITYEYSDGIVNVFRNNEEKIKLKDQVYENNVNKSRQLFMPGRFMVFNILFDGPKQITMDAVVSDWDDIEEYEMSTDPVDDEDEGGGDQQGGDQQGGDPEP